MADPGQKQVTVSISRLTGYLDGVISNAEKAKAELEAARKAKVAAASTGSLFMKLARTALSGGKKP